MEPRTDGPVFLGRYELHRQLGAGGMASVHLGRLLGAAGFSRTVAIKRLHPNFAQDPDVVAMLFDEARLAARIHHPNVASTLDVVTEKGEAFIVMDYLHGESLARLLGASKHAKNGVPFAVIASIFAGALHGLHAAHEARDENGAPLGIVHRDISPQNILVGADGTTRVLDFGIAKAANRIQTTREGKVKGKLRYMTPEQLAGDAVDRRADIFATGIVLWEALTLRRFVAFEDPRAAIAFLLAGAFDPPSRYTSVPAALDAIVMRALCSDPCDRFSSAREMALAIEETVEMASPTRVAAWVHEVAADSLRARAALVAEVESSTSSVDVPVRNSLTTGLPAVPRRVGGAIATGVLALGVLTVVSALLWPSANIVKTPLVAASTRAALVVTADVPVPIIATSTPVVALPATTAPPRRMHASTTMKPTAVPSSPTPVDSTEEMYRRR